METTDEKKPVPGAAGREKMRIAREAVRAETERLDRLAREAYLKKHAPPSGQK